ncbi:MaoC family dehydratase [Actinomadura atramentaria]|uniref:MaoC family dehydratase n=1 Tax=Actinomadura atramentaria TaxID=1990 RepID=UPI00037C09EB|nr:MaoC/PaaZ C-terminal domain-containing protein [Actinomadura atramentaria]
MTAALPAPGAELPPLRHAATRLQLFRYSAVTWNPHRIHFEEEYARSEGHAGTLVHSHLRAALALRCVAEGLPGWTIAEVKYRVRRPVVPGTELVYGARVREAAGDAAVLELTETHPGGEVGLAGTVTVRRAGREADR